MKNKRKKGFTLIELIIVVAIIGILAAIAVPKFGDIQKNSKIKADVATGKIIADTVAVLVAENQITTAVTTKTPVVSGNLVAGKLQSIPTSAVYKNASFYYIVGSDLNPTVYIKKGSVDAYVEVYPNVVESQFN